MKECAALLTSFLSLPSLPLSLSLSLFAASLLSQCVCVSLSLSLAGLSSLSVCVCLSLSLLPASPLSLSVCVCVSLSPPLAQRGPVQW